MSEPRGGRPVWLWIAVGCGGIFVLSGLIAVGVIAYGAYWVFSPGRQHPTAAVVTAGSVGVVRIDDAAGDPGVRALSESALEAVRLAQLDAQGGSLPPAFVKFQRWQAAQGSGGLAIWLPRDVAVSLTRVAGDSDGDSDGDSVGFVAAANLQSFVRPMRFLIEQMVRTNQHGHTVVRPYRGHDLLLFPGGGASFVDGTLVLSSHADLLSPAVDRLLDAPHHSPISISSLKDLEGNWDLYGELTDPDLASGLVAAILRAAGEGSLGSEVEGEPDVSPLSSRLRVLQFGVNVVSADEIQLMLRAGYETDEAAREGRLQFEGIRGHATELANRAGVEASFGVESDGTEVELESSFTGVESALRRWVAQTARAARDRRRPEPANEMLGAASP